MDYKDIIQSIVSSFLDDVEYKHRTEEEDEDFDFWDWWDEVDAYDYLCTTVDCYASGNWQSHLNIILAAGIDPDDVDEGLWEGSKSWKKSAGCVAYEVLRQEAQSVIEAHVQNNEPEFEPGGVLPESNEVQIWLGKEAPVVIFEGEMQPRGLNYDRRATIPEYITTRDFWKIMYLGMSLVFEGQTEETEPRDFKELCTGGRKAMCPRRIYIMDANGQTVQALLALALSSGWISIPDYDHYKTVLPQLSVL